MAAAAVGRQTLPGPVTALTRLSPVLVALVVAAAVAGLLILLLWAFQRSLIFLPYGSSGAPADHGLPDAEEVVLRTADGLSLDAWFVPPSGRATGTAVLVLPGNAGNRAHRAPLAAALVAAGHGALLLDYRGYGGNPGSPSEEGVGIDARAGLAHLDGRDDVDRVAYWGESLGAAVAVDLALDAPPVALVLRSPFTSLVDMGRRHYPFLPVRPLLRDRFDVVARIGEVKAPVLVIAGGQDGIVPPAMSREVAEAAGARLVVVEGADHNDVALLAGDQLLDEALGFLAHHGS